MSEPSVKQFARLSRCLVETVSVGVQQEPLGIAPVLGTGKDFVDLLHDLLTLVLCGRVGFE
jgi:hypothetical protein